MNSVHKKVIDLGGIIKTKTTSIQELKIDNSIINCTSFLDFIENLKNHFMNRRKIVI